MNVTISYFVIQFITINNYYIMFINYNYYDKKLIIFNTHSLSHTLTIVSIIIINNSQ